MTGRRHLRVVLGGEGVADVVHQRGDDPVDVGPVALGTGGRLQRVLQTTDPVAAEAVVEQAQVGQDAVGQCVDVLPFEGVQELVLLLGAVAHLGELHCLHHTTSITRPPSQDLHHTTHDRSSMR